jgi:hypothetical protein
MKHSKLELKYIKGLKGLIADMEAVIANIDKTMKLPHSLYRDQLLSQTVNSMDFSLDYANHFVLDMSFKAISKAKKEK